MQCLHRPVVIINQQYTKGEIHFINNKDTLFANFRPRGLYQAKSSITQYSLHDIHLSLTKASALSFKNISESQSESRAVFGTESASEGRALCAFESSPLKTKIFVLHFRTLSIPQLGKARTKNQACHSTRVIGA